MPVERAKELRLIHTKAAPYVSIRVVHPGGQYEFMFPIDNSCELVDYEIERRRGFRF